MRVLVCGGRDYTNKQVLFDYLDFLHDTNPFSVLIEGEAKGADTLARDWAIERGVGVDAYPAQWERLGGRAGPIRNQQMLDEGKPELVVAFPGGRGTAHMIRISKEADVEVIEVQCEI